MTLRAQLHWLIIAGVTIPGCGDSPTPPPPTPPAAPPARSAPPPAPSALYATSQPPSTIALSWSNHHTAATAVLIERATASAGFAQIVSLPGDATSHFDTNLTTGTAYQYRVRAANSAGPGKYSNVASASLPAACLLPVEVTQPINSATIWPRGEVGCVHYRVTGSIAISAPLVVEGGTIVAFGRNASLSVTSGSLSALGLDTAQIRFIGEDTTRGYWQGLEIRSASDANELTHVEIAHGGGGSGSDRANIAVGPGGRLRLMNSTIRDSQGWGLFIGSTGVVTPLPIIANNTFRNNALGDVRQ
jgi:hypothetical protein